LSDLQHFKSTSALDPEANLKQTKAQTQLAAQLISQLEQTEHDFMAKFEVERRNAEQLVINRVMEIIEAASNGLSAVLRNKTLLAHQENQRLKREIAFQLAAHNELEGEMQILLSLAKDRPRTADYDPRRWKMKDRMTCTPDMDVTCA
jgi:hypothetical protein